MMNTVVADSLYTALFCEENIWELVRVFEQEGRALDDLDVVFLCNDKAQLAIRNQKLASPGTYVIWDYHVILIDRRASLVYDFDSRLGFPVSLDEYLYATLPDPSHVHEGYLPSFRLIPARDYLYCFCSDRSHMRGMIPDEQFPARPMITCREDGKAVRLDQYWDINVDITGTLRLNQSEFIQYYQTRASVGF